MYITSLEIKHINGHTHVSRLFWTPVQIPIVQRNQIDIVENETIPVAHFIRL